MGNGFGQSFTSSRCVQHSRYYSKRFHPFFQRNGDISRVAATARIDPSFYAFQPALLNISVPVYSESLVGEGFDEGDEIPDLFIPESTSKTDRWRAVQSQRDSAEEVRAIGATTVMGQA